MGWHNKINNKARYIIKVIKPFEDRGILLKRTTEKIIGQEGEDYSVIFMVY